MRTEPKRTNLAEHMDRDKPMEKVEDVLDHFRVHPQNSLRHNQALKVEGINFVYNYNKRNSIEQICIIDGPMVERARNNAAVFGLNTKIFDSFYIFDSNKNFQSQKVIDVYNHTILKNIEIPESYKNITWLKQVKIKNHLLTHREVCRLLNHMVLWDYCTQIGQPIIVMENNVMFYSDIPRMQLENTIISLSNKNFKMHNENYICLESASAYSIDELMASKLLSEIFTKGVIEPIEFMIRVDKHMVFNSPCAFSTTFV